MDYARGLNTSLAFFIHDAFSLMDRGFVFQLIRTYLKKVPTNRSPTQGIGLGVLGWGGGGFSTCSVSSVLIKSLEIQF